MLSRAFITRATIRGVLLAVAAGMVMAAEPAVFERAERLPLTATSIPLDPQDAAHRDVGRLRYMGGLALRSTNANFGGVSALRAGRDGWLLGITDTGTWVSLRTVERGGRLVGAVGGTIAPLRSDTGAVAHAKSDVDAEGLEWDPATGDALVSLEGDHRVMVYRGIDPARPASLDTNAVATIRNPATARWSSNSGGEAIATLAGGDRLIFEEGDAQPTLDVLRIGGGGTQVLHYTPPTGYRPTDAVEIEPGVMLVLNRHFAPSDGVAAALTLVPVGAAMQGTEIARIKPPLNIDNMEGMALVRVAGRTFIYLVSDDNFNGFQRTLLMKFELMPTR
ncbi:esterase-like activity of phytase family protein [Sphingosinicellaceae bacterium]|nr:esterase-like activity of phytase family protein [Sphingosinicellaceae bacterium]